jgi:hypothetical protein
MNTVITGTRGANMFEDEQSYYQRRAEAEVERAQAATAPAAVRAHYELAEAYFAKLATTERIEVVAS